MSDHFLVCIINEAVLIMSSCIQNFGSMFCLPPFKLDIIEDAALFSIAICSILKMPIWKLVNLDIHKQKSSAFLFKLFLDAFSIRREVRIIDPPIILTGTLINHLFWRPQFHPFNCMYHNPQKRNEINASVSYRYANVR